MIRHLPAAMVLSLIVAACGGDTPDDATAASSTSSTSTATGESTEDGADEPVAPSTDDVAVEDSANPENGDPVPPEVDGQPLLVGADDEVAATRDRLARSLGVRPAFDAVVLASARGYDYLQLVAAAAADALQPDGTIIEGDSVLAPARPSNGPQGFRAPPTTAPGPPLDRQTMNDLYKEIARVDRIADGFGDSARAADIRDLAVLESVIIYAAAGLPIEEVITIVLLDVVPSCDTLRQSDYLKGVAEMGMCDETTSASTTVAPETTVDTPAPSTPSPEPAPTTAVTRGDRAYVGTVQFDLGASGEAATLNDLYVIATADGLLGSFDYQASATDGSYCYQANAALDDRAVIETSPGQYAGPVQVDVTFWAGACGSVEPEVFFFPTQLTGQLEGNTITGTLTAEGSTISYTAVLEGVGS